MTHEIHESLPKVTKVQDARIYLTRRGYVLRKSHLTPEKIKWVQKTLQVQPHEKNAIHIQQYGPLPPSFKVFAENANKLYVPRFWGIKHFGMPQFDQLENQGTPTEITFQGSLRPEQEKIMERYMPILKSTGGGILNLPCAQGKTVMALYIISQIQLKTLVIVHKSFLMDQWIERIQQFLPKAKIGRIQGSVVDIEDCSIVLAMLQSVSMKTYDDDIFSSFGLVVADECHHLGAEVFSRALAKISTKYMVGLSATLERKDGLDKVFKWYLGSPVTIQSNDETTPGKPKNADVIAQMIKLIDPQFQIPSYNIRGTLNLPALINKIVESPKRNDFIVAQTQKLCNDQKRKILIISERRGHLKVLCDKFSQLNIDSGLYVGGLKQSDLKEATQKQVLLGTYHMISEGFDLPELNTLIMATPKTDIIQTVGRILRQKPECRARPPLIIDIWDECVSLKTKGDQRKRYYKKNGFQVSTFDTFQEYQTNIENNEKNIQNHNLRQ